MNLTLTALATFILSGVAAWLVANVVVPLLVRLLEPQRYADPYGLDGCAQILFVAAVSTAWALLLEKFHTPFPDSAILPALVLLPGQLLYGLILLRWTGHGQTRQTFTGDGSVVRARKTGEVLDVLCVHPEAHYRQTDAYRGFAWYTVTVRTRDGRTFANGFTQCEEWERACEALLAVAPSLDLNFVCAKAPGVWQVVAIADAWLPLLAGQPERLPAEHRDFWLSLLRPHLGASEERAVDKERLKGHIAALRTAFGGVAEENVGQLERFVEGCAGAPIAMTAAQRDARIRRDAPEAQTFVYREDGVAHYDLRPP